MPALRRGTTGKAGRLRSKPAAARALPTSSARCSDRSRRSESDFSEPSSRCSPESKESSLNSSMRQAGAIGARKVLHSDASVRGDFRSELAPAHRARKDQCASRLRARARVSSSANTSAARAAVTGLHKPRYPLIVRAFRKPRTVPARFSPGHLRLCASSM